MRQHAGRGSQTWGRVRAYAAAILFVATIGCRHNAPETDAEYEAPPQPVHVHVKNENFLDVNVSAVVSGVSRRLGTVTGNSSQDFTIGWNVANGQAITLLAQPIGGPGGVTSPALTVGAGQVIEFKIGSVFRQSSATVHDP